MSSIVGCAKVEKGGHLARNLLSFEPMDLRPYLFPRLALILLGLLPLPKGLYGKGSEANPATECKRRSLVLVMLGPESVASLNLQRAFEEALTRRPCFEALDVVEYLEAGEAGEGLTSAREELDLGRNAFLQMDLEKAKDHLESSVEAFSSGFAGLEYTGPFVDALMLLGATEAILGHKERAALAFKKALILRPDVTPEPYSTLQEVLAAFDAAKRGLSGEGSVAVRSEPEGAQVFLDGKDFLGITPIESETVRAGPHWLVLRKTGFIRQVVYAEVAPNKTFLAETPLMPARKKPLYDLALAKLERRKSPGDTSGLDDLRAIFLADLALLVKVNYRPFGLEVLAELWDLLSLKRLWSGVDYQKGQEGVIALGLAESILTQALGPIALLDVASDTNPIREAQEKRSIWSKWWFWATVGAVIVGSTSAALIVTRPKETRKVPPSGPDGAVLIRF